MGNLPKQRCQSKTVFEVTGVDYAGPYSIKDRKDRGAKISTCSFALFIYFATKAVHLELVTDRSKDAFILTLRRLISRRDKPSRIFSDNGINFIAANYELLELGKFFTQNKDPLTEALSKVQIEWTFIPPSLPHFGGIWERNIKSCKFHLKRVMGNTLLTFEEFYTLLVQVEAVLNSRPLIQISDDPDDLIPLTPAHFLIGKTISTLPDQDLTHLPEGRLTKYQHIQQTQQHFWNRWQKEYIAELQQRVRWKTKQGELKDGALVVIKEDNIPPMSCRLGRIVQLHPGKNNISRVATLKTARGLIKRAFSKICPLPCLD